MPERLARARVLCDRRDLEAAEREVRAVLQDDAADADALEVLARIHVERHEYTPAQEALLLATRHRKPFPDASALLALVCNRTGWHETALQMAELTLAAEPEHREGRTQAGIALRALGRYEESERILATLPESPGAVAALAETLLAAGDFARGLPLYERRRAGHPVGAGLASEEWRGEPRPNARLLVLPERGLSDFLLMSRFLPELANRFEGIVVLAPAPLQRLVQAIEPRLEVVRSLPDARHDLWVPVGSLALRLGVRNPVDSFTQPLLRFSGTAAAPGQLRIGVHWGGHLAHPCHAIRTTSLRTLAPLLEVEGIEWTSLHRRSTGEDAPNAGMRWPLTESSDLLDTATVISDLDVVVSTDSAVAHLSAGMGIPTCVLSPQDAHWSWSGWYRGVTLCAQREAGNWNGPMSDVAGALLALSEAA